MAARRARTSRSNGAEELARLLGQARRRVFLACAQALHSRGGSILAFQLLARLVIHGPSTQVDLAVATAQHPAGVSRLLDELERDGLVRRTRDRDDRRKLQVESTPTGRARFRTHEPLLLAAVDDALAVLTRSERKALRALLLKLVAGPVADAAPHAPKARSPARSSSPQQSADHAGPRPHRE